MRRLCEKKAAFLEKIARREPGGQGDLGSDSLPTAGRISSDTLPTTAISLAAQHGLNDVVRVLLSGPERVDGKVGWCGWDDAELAEAIVRGSTAGYFNRQVASSASDNWETDAVAVGGTVDSETRLKCFQACRSPLLSFSPLHTSRLASPLLLIFITLPSPLA